MRKVLSLFIFMFVCDVLAAQEPTSTWPYLYNDFQDATVFFKDGSKRECKVNIHILNSKFHYLEGEDIMEAKSADILLVSIGNDSFYSKQGLMMKAVAANDKGFVGEVTVVDMAALNSQGGAAYGSSANSVAVNRLSSIEGSGPSASTNHMNLKNEKDLGVLLPVEKEYYIVTKGNVYPANRKNLELLLPSDKKSGFKAFLKQNKISWKSPASLLKIVDYING